MTNVIPMTVLRRHELTPDITEFALVAADHLDDSWVGPLAPAEAGAHITVQTPAGAMRRYSLVHPSDTPEHYTIAVKREAESRGGSESMHSSLQQGDILNILPPENDFALTVANDYLLIAGGIGITPIYSMAQQLAAEDKTFQLIYCTRSASDTPYADELNTLCGEKLTLHHDAGNTDNLYDFWDWFKKPGKAHVYCCGPEPLMEEIRAISGHWPEGSVHFEQFKTVDVVRDDDRPMRVTLNKSKVTIDVPAERSILEAIRDAGVLTTSSCESGTCGTCKCGLLEGDADHRDLVLMDDEKDKHIMICVSRAVGDHLVLDL